MRQIFTIVNAGNISDSFYCTANIKRMCKGSYGNYFFYFFIFYLHLTKKRGKLRV